MTKPRIVRVSTDPAQVPEIPRAEAQELIGWSRGVARPQRPNAAVTRRVVAAALGISPEALAGVDSDDLHAALRRLRELAARADRLAAEAATDDLTGALRRGTGLDALQREIDRARRIDGSGTVVAFLDLDGLKQVNDTEGHSAGDKLLRHVVAAIRERIRSYDLVFRYGGDEFVCVLVDVSAEQARQTIADIRRRVRARTGGHTVSVGMATVDARDDAERVVARADAALYRARRRAAMAGIQEAQSARRFTDSLQQSS